jgi:uncharacterized protein (TIGR03790 family)
MKPLALSLAASSLIAVAAARAAAQQDVGPDGVLVVVSDASAISQAIGTYYATARGIASDHVFHLGAKTPLLEEITRGEYDFRIRDKLVNFFTNTRPDLKDTIKYIVLTKDVPLKINDPDGAGTTTAEAASVDSELTQLFTNNVPDGGQAGKVTNPFFRTYHSPANWSNANLSYMVFRLDGYQTNVDATTGVPADILALINNSLNPATSGSVLLDATNATTMGNDWMVTANDLLVKMNFPVTLDTTGTMRSGYSNLLGYCSWGSNDPANAGVPYYGEIPAGSGVFWPGTFVNGALTSDYVSTSARTYVDGNQNYGQSLEADLIRMGVCGTNGHVYEPYLDAVVFPQYLFPHYLQGLQAGLAYYHALPYLSWMNVVVCDPLMKSAVTAPVPPVFTDITPTRVASGSSAVRITFHGDFFTSSEDTTVSLGGVPCANVYVPTVNGCGCDSGTLPPGLLDLQMTDFMGTSVWSKAVVSYPALDLTGDVSLGGAITISAYGDVNDLDLTFLSLGTASIPLNPYGVLGLDLTNHFMLLFSAVLPAQQYDIPGTLPSDPAYSGFSFYLQSLIGPDLATKNMKFTNVVGVTIP